MHVNKTARGSLDMSLAQMGDNSRFDSTPSRPVGRLAWKT